MTLRTRDDSREPGIHRRTWKAHKDHGTRELQAQLWALERSSQNSLSQSQHPRGHSSFSSSSWGKRRVGEAFPWRGEHLLCLWILVFGSMRSSQGDPLAVPSLQKHRGIPTAFPEFLQSSAKLPLSIKITGERIYPSFPSVQGIGGNQK